MAGRNRAVTAGQTNLRLPPELILLVRAYQSGRRLVSLSMAVKELLETHPQILAIVAQSQYDNINQLGDPERVPV